MTDAEFDAAIAALAPWVGRTRIVEDEIGLSSARRIAGMLDMDPASITQGMALPPHWFSMFFPDIARQSDIGPDGHPNKGVFLPPIPLPRRMGAGRRVTIKGNLVVGEPAIKKAEVAAIVPKHGRTGRMAVLTMPPRPGKKPPRPHRCRPPKTPPGRIRCCCLRLWYSAIRQ